MKKWLIGGAAVTGAVVLAAASWYFRPWADYSPAKVMTSRSAPDRAPIYRDMESYFPYREIKGADDATPLPRALRPLDIRYDVDGVARTLDTYAADFAITGLMVVQNGAVIFEQYWRGESADDRHTSWSVAKSFVSTLVGIALAEGKIASLDDTVETYAPLYRGTDYGQTSIGALLAMSTGIDFEEDYEVVGSDIRKLFFNTFIMNRDIDRFVRKYRRERPAGQDFEYLSPNTSALAAAVAGAYDRPLADLVSEKIFVPAGMKGGTWLLDRNARDGKELAYCCINIPLEDYARFGLIYLNGGVMGGQRILPESWTRFVGVPPGPTHMDDLLAKGAQYGYGQHFWVPTGDTGAFFAAGYNGQFVWIDPATNTVLAMTSADTKYPGSNREAHRLHRAIIAAAAAAAPRQGVN